MKEHPLVTTVPILQRINALGDATRTRMLRMLEQQELTVAELCTVLQLPQSTVSRHLKILADDRWVVVRREGTSRFYHLALEGLDRSARQLWLLVREEISDWLSLDQDDQRLTAVLDQRQSRSQAYFAGAARQWHQVRSELFGSRFDLLALAGLLDRQWVLGDLGCGTGQLTGTLAPFVEQVVAVDGSRQMLRAGRERWSGLDNVDWRHGSMESLPIVDDELDAAVAMVVLHHVADPKRALSEMRRAVKAGGRVLIVDMTRHDRQEYQQQMGHVWLGFAPEQMTEWLTEVGFAEARWVLLPSDAEARGPGLFAATALG